MSELLIPLNEVTAADNTDVQTFGEVTPRRVPTGDNYADDAGVLSQIRDELCALISQTRSDRAALHDEWQAIRRMEMLIHDSGQTYRGRSNAYLPVYSRMLKTQVSTLTKGIFPSDDYMDCQDRASGNPDRAKASKTYVQWELERNAKIRKHMKVFLRQLKAYGNSPLKYLYRKEQRYEGRNFNMRDMTGALLGQESAFIKASYEGLQVSARSIFNWYVYPMTADSLEEASLVFEDIEMPRMYIEAQGKRSSCPWKNVEEALRAPPVPEVETNRDDLHGSSFGVNNGNSTNGALAQVITLTEAWTFLKLPKSAYVMGENPDCPVPVCVILAGDIPVCVIRNPYFHQRPPYLFGRLNAHPGMIYGYDVGRLGRYLQYLVNDFANQTNDTGTYTLNPIGIVNPALVAGPMGSIAPGRMWSFTDIDKGFRFDRPPVELVQHGAAHIAMHMNWMQDLGGAPPQLSGSGSGGQKTATGMQILQRNAMSPLQDEVEDVEQDVMVPLMYGTWYNGQQFRDKQVLAQIAGQEMAINPGDLAIEAEFRWLASSQAVNAQQRSQQLFQAITTIAPLTPLLMQQGYIVDFGPLLQRALGDGMGIRGISDIIKKAQVAPMGGGPVPPEAMGGVMAEQGDRARSAVEQAGGAYGEAVPGEAEDFQDVRSQADAMAAAMGSTYGQG